MKIVSNNIGEASRLSTVARQTGWKPLLLGVVLLAGCDQPMKLPPDGFAAKAMLSRDTLQVGDPVTLTLTAHHPTGSTVHFPTIGKGKEIVVHGRSIDTQERTKETFETEEIYKLTSFRIGNWALTTNPIVCTFADGREKEQALSTLILHVQSTLNESNANKLSDIKGPAKPPFRILRRVWVPALIVLLALIAGLITLLFMKKPKATIGSEPAEPAHVRAKRALDSLRKSEWIPEPFFVRLSLILRTYLEDRFDLNAPESTTEELAGKLKHDPQLDTDNRNSLQRFFTQADLVKFARAGAEQEVMQTAFDTVTQFIDQTQQEESLPEESTKNSK